MKKDKLITHYEGIGYSGIFNGRRAVGYRFRYYLHVNAPVRFFYVKTRKALELEVVLFACRGYTVDNVTAIGKTYWTITYRYHRPHSQKRPWEKRDE